MKVNEDIKPSGDSRQIERQEPDNLRELDMEVARMLEPAPPDFDPGCALLLLEPPKLSPKRGWLHVHIFDHGDACEWEPRPFSRSIEAAMEVVEKMWQLGWQVEITNHHKLNTLVTDKIGIWYVRFVGAVDCRRDWSAESESLPKAVCRAALAALAEKES